MDNSDKIVTLLFILTIFCPDRRHRTVLRRSVFVSVFSMQDRNMLFPFSAKRAGSRLNTEYGERNCIAMNNTILYRKEQA